MQRTPYSASHFAEDCDVIGCHRIRTFRVFSDLDIHVLAPCVRGQDSYKHMSRSLEVLVLFLPDASAKSEEDGKRRCRPTSGMRPALRNL